jgi:MFS family permease
MSPARAFVRLEGLSAFRHRNFRLFWAGQLISLVGTWMQQVAQAWLVLTLTNDPFMLGVVAAAQFAPVLLLGLFGGIIADGLPKRRTLIATQSIAMTLAFVLAILTATGIVEVWHILVLALLLGCSNAVDMPTRQSFVIEMVGREDIGNAVALNSAVFNGSRIVGPAIAGLTIGAFDVSIAFFLNGVSFIAVLAGLLAMREEDLRPATRSAMPRTVRAVVDNLAEGLSYVRRTRAVLLAVAVVGLVATAGMNFSVVVPALSRDVLGSGPSGYGFLMAASGIGSLTSALGVAFLGRPGTRVLVGGALVLGILEVLLALSRSMPLSLVCMFGVGAGGIAMAMTANTTIQLSVPDALRGRVMAVYTTLFAGSTPVGGLAFGALAGAAGAAAAILAGGLIAVGIAIGAGILAWRWGMLGRRAQGVVLANAAAGVAPASRAAGEPTAGVPVSPDTTRLGYRPPR